MTDLYTMLSQEEFLNILIEFGITFSYQKVRGIPLRGSVSAKNLLDSKQGFQVD